VIFTAHRLLLVCLKGRYVMVANVGPPVIHCLSVYCLSTAAISN